MSLSAPALFRFALLFAAAAAGLRADPTLALSDGEALTYHVSWVVIPGAGQIRVSARAETGPGGEPRMRISSTTSTWGLAYLLLPFTASANSIFDRRTGRLLTLSEASDTRSRRAAHTVVFDYAHRLADYTRTVPPEPPRALPMPPGDPTDLITCLMLSRKWNLKPGQKRDTLVLFDDDFYQLTIHAVGEEFVDTDLGVFRTVVLEPRMEETPPKGMFRRGSTVRVWVSEDSRRLPVRFEVMFKFGSGLATIAYYHPPTAAK